MLLELKSTEFIEQLSSSAPTPGGGGASALVGALATALGMMAANLTVGKKKYKAVEEEIIDAREHLFELQKKLIILVDKDAEGFLPLAKAYSLPKSTPEERAEKDRIMEAALYEACKVPLEIMETCYATMDYLQTLAAKGSRLVVSDVGTAVSFARSAVLTASLNVFINSKMMKNREKAEELNHRADVMIDQARRIERKIYSDVLSDLRGSEYLEDFFRHSKAGDYTKNEPANEQ
ncbi:MAG: cyclodeaminase/cyclohydrolase family protein [Dorea sp.]|nr:cyclodeaminase/cyclohydrolase family protein [Dorea sp.]